MKKLLKEKVGFRGRVTLTNYLIESEEAHNLQNYIDSLGEISQAYFEQLEQKLCSLCTIKETVFNNAVVMSGRSVFTRLMVADTTYTGEINWGAVGTSATAVADTQTTLVAEVKRKGIATRVRTDDSVTLRFFFTKADVAGTFEEFACFIDGTSTVDTGQMYNRALTGGWIKSALEAMTVTVTLDLNAA